MITEIYVNGYRSLTDFRIPVSAGLNVLVGPNGGGKTNILSFFEFLSKLIGSPVDEAVSSHGGVGRVFTRLPDNNFNRTLSARVRGNIKCRTATNRPVRIWYTWEFEISSSEAYDEIAYTKQSLYVDIDGEPRIPANSDLIISGRFDENGARVVISSLVISRLQHLFQLFSFYRSGYVTKQSASRMVHSYSRIIDPSKECIVAALRGAGEVHGLLSRDIRGGETYNFVPEICKQPEDSARPPVVEKNGAGLASTLYRVERHMESRPAAPWASRPSRFPLRIVDMNKIRQYVGLISESVGGIYAQKNPIDNKISVFVSITEEGEDVAFPLAHCSDGTVKWIALVVTLLTQQSGFAIEEPENFLHPNIQKEFVNIVRSEAGTSSSSFTLMTTHSESLLNEASPSEIVLVWMESGITVAKRISDSESIVTEINRTGFGLGHYYAAGSLHDA